MLGRKRSKIRAPQRDGWLEVHEELARVSFLERHKHEYKRKWVLLRDCWLYLCDNQEDVGLGMDDPNVLAIDLRGSLCQRHSAERTFSLESSALYTIHGHKRKMLFRTAAEEDIQPWVSDINESSIWEMVLRAAVSTAPQGGGASRKGKARGSNDDSRSACSSRSEVSRMSAASQQTASSQASRASRSSSLAASLSHSLSSLSRYREENKRRRAPLDSGPFPQPQLGDVPEDDKDTPDELGASSSSPPHPPEELAASEAGSVGESCAPPAAAARAVELGATRGEAAATEHAQAAPQTGSGRHVLAKGDTAGLWPSRDAPKGLVQHDPISARNLASVFGGATSGACSHRGSMLAGEPRPLPSLATQASWAPDEGEAHATAPNKARPAGDCTLHVMRGSSRQLPVYGDRGLEAPASGATLEQWEEEEGGVMSHDARRVLEMGKRGLVARRHPARGSMCATESRAAGPPAAQSVAEVQVAAEEVQVAMGEYGGDQEGGGVGLGALFADARRAADGGPAAGAQELGSVCDGSEAGFSVLDDVVTLYTEDASASGDELLEEASSVDASDDERVEQERKEFFREALCLRGSDSEDDLTDLDRKLETRDVFERRRVRVRRVRRFCRRKVAVSGVAHTWGSGYHWCLGHGSHVDERYPRILRPLRTKGIVQLAAGGQHAAALSSSGQIFTWGEGMFGRLGHGDMRDCPKPTLMETTRKGPLESQAAQVACGHAHSVFVTRQGQVWCWGQGLYGELGLENRNDQWSPVQVIELQGLYVSFVACGQHFTLACTGAGVCYSWGRGKFGCLGLGDCQDRLKPERIAALSRVHILKLSVARSNPLALTEDGKLYSWGCGKFGAHGHGHSSDLMEPKQMHLPEDRIIVDMACGRHHCAMLNIRGEVWCWGSGQGYALGNGKEADSPEPLLVKAIHKFVIVQVSCGGNRTAALARGGNLYMWGGGTAVFDPEKFSDYSTKNFSKLHVSEEGGVVDMRPTVGFFEQIRKDLANPELFPEAQADKLPRELIKAAFDEGIKPDRLLRLRFELIDGAAQAVSSFSLKQSVLSGLPLVHPDWATCDRESPEWLGQEAVGAAAVGAAACVGGGSRGSKEIVRLQQAINALQSHAADTQEAMRVEAQVAQRVLELSMRSVPKLALNGSQHVNLLLDSSVDMRTDNDAAREYRGPPESARAEEEGSSVAPGTWASDVSFAEGFDLSAALESTQEHLFGVQQASLSAVAGKPPVRTSGAPVPWSLVARNRSDEPDRTGSAQAPLARASSHTSSHNDGAGELGEAERDAWSYAEPDNVSCDDDGDGVSESVSVTSKGNNAMRGDVGLSDAAALRKSLAQPRLLRQLMEEVVLVVLGDGFSMVLCNKKEAATGVLCAQELRVDSKLRHAARVAQRAYDELRKIKEEPSDGHKQKGSSGILSGGPMPTGKSNKTLKREKGGKVYSKGKDKEDPRQKKAGKQQKKWEHETAGVKNDTHTQDEIEEHAFLKKCASVVEDSNDDTDTADLHRRSAETSATSRSAGSCTPSDTTHTSATPSGESASTEGHEQGGDKRKRKKNFAVSQKMKAVKEEDVYAGGRVQEQNVLQGWMVVHEIKMQVRLPEYIAKHLEEPKMRWDKRWMVLNHNELFMFESPVDAQPLGRVVLDSCFISDVTKETHWEGMADAKPRQKSQGECKIPTLEIKPNIISTSGANNSRHIYCRTKDFQELHRWIEALREAAVLRIVRNTMVPFENRPWDADIDWSLPDTNAAWDTWRDPEEKQQLHFIDSTLDLPAGAVEGASVVKSDVDENSTPGGSLGGLTGLLAGVVAGMTPRWTTTRTSESTSTPASAFGSSQSTAVLEGRQGAVSTLSVLPAAGAVDDARCPAPTDSSTKIAHLPAFPVSKTFFPALVGTHMEEMSRVLDETRQQLVMLKEHHRAVLRENALQASTWSFEKKHLEELLHQRTLELSQATTEIARLNFEIDSSKASTKRSQMAQCQAFHTLSPSPQAEADAAGSQQDLVLDTFADRSCLTMGASQGPHSIKESQIEPSMHQSEPAALRTRQGLRAASDTSAGLCTVEIQSSFCTTKSASSEVSGPAGVRPCPPRRARMPPVKVLAFPCPPTKDPTCGASTAVGEKHDSSCEEELGSDGEIEAVEGFSVEI